MESESPPLPNVPESHSKSLYSGVYLDLFVSVMGIIACYCLMAMTTEFNTTGQYEAYKNFYILALICCILRTPVIILILIGNKIENLRLLWLGLQGARMLIVISFIMAIASLWYMIGITFWFLPVGFLGLSLTSCYPDVHASNRIDEIKSRSGADTTA